MLVIVRTKKLLHLLQSVLAILSLTLVGGQSMTAQTTEWKYMHKGNRAFEAQDYAEAELNYLKALKENPRSSRALFNLGDVQLAKNNPQAAYDYFDQSLKLESDTLVQAMACHNQGYIYHTTAMSSTKEEERQQYLRMAIERYKESLRKNPLDEDTRYNLALCQKLLKPSPEQQGQNQNQQKDSQQQDEQQQQKQEQQQPQQSENSQDDRKTDQLLNLSRQAEKRTKEKVDKALQNPRQKRLEKNW
jgi:Ca-activated chloride channel family protein